MIRAIEYDTGLSVDQIAQAAQNVTVINAIVTASQTATGPMIGNGYNGTATRPNGGAGGWLVGNGGNGYNSTSAKVNGGNGGAAGIFFGNAGNGGNGGSGANGGNGASATLFSVTAVTAVSGATG